MIERSESRVFVVSPCPQALWVGSVFPLLQLCNTRLEQRNFDES